MFCAQSHVTYVILTHRSRRSLAHRDRVALMRRMILAERAEAFYRRPVDLFAARFCSSSGIGGSVRAENEALLLDNSTQPVDRRVPASTVWPIRPQGGSVAGTGTAA